MLAPSKRSVRRNSAIGNSFTASSAGMFHNGTSNALDQYTDVSTGQNKWKRQPREDFVFGGSEIMHVKLMKISKIACAVFIILYSMVIGSFLAVLRDFIWFYCRYIPMELPGPTKFITEYCYSTSGYSPYFTYVEIMLIAVFFIWIPMIVRKKNTVSCLLVAMCGFMGQTFFGALLGLIILAPLCAIWRPERLNPPQDPTTVAIFIHYIALLSVFYVVLAILRAVRWKK